MLPILAAAYVEQIVDGHCSNVAACRCKSVAKPPPWGRRRLRGRVLSPQRRRFVPPSVEPAPRTVEGRSSELSSVPWRGGARAGCVWSMVDPDISLVGLCRFQPDMRQRQPTRRRISLVATRSARGVYHFLLSPVDSSSESSSSSLLEQRGRFLLATSPCWLGTAHSADASSQRPRASASSIRHRQPRTPSVGSAGPCPCEWPGCW